MTERPVLTGQQVDRGRPLPTGLAAQLGQQFPESGIAILPHEEPHGRNGRPPPAGQAMKLQATIGPVGKPIIQVERGRMHPSSHTRTKKELESRKAKGPRRHLRATIRQLGESLWHSWGTFTEEGEVLTEWDYWSFNIGNALDPLEKAVPSAFSCRSTKMTGEWPRYRISIDCDLRHNAKDYVPRPSPLAC